MKRFLLFLLIPLQLLVQSCSDNQPKSAQLTISKEPGISDVEFWIYTSDYLVEGYPDYTLKLNSTDSIQTLSFPLNEHRIINIQSGFGISDNANFLKHFVVQPGGELRIDLKRGNDGYVKLNTSGTSSSIQHVLDKYDSLDDVYLNERKTTMTDQDWEWIDTRLNGMEDQKRAWISNDFSNEAIELLEWEIYGNRIELLDALTIATISEEAQEIVNKKKAQLYSELMRIDNRALASSAVKKSINDYVGSVGFEYYGYTGEDFMADPDETAKSLFEKVIEDGTIKDEFKDLMLTNYLMLMSQLVSVDMLLGLKNNHEFSASATSTLAKIFKDYDHLAPGKESPDFSFTDIDGNQKSLADYKGKVIYIDFWATWCGPCIEEFKFYPELYERLGGAQDVVFLMASVDQPSQSERWAKAVKRYGLENFTNTLLENALESDMPKAFNVTGIPRYVLIDLEGKIVSAQAYRPSSGDLVYEQIQQLRSVPLEMAK